MRLWEMAATIAAMAASAQALAAEPTVAGSGLPGLCGPQRAGPFLFGVPEVEARSGAAPSVLDPAYAPFTRASLRTTSWSDVAMLVEFRAAIAAPEAGAAAENMVAAAFEKSGWNLLGDAPGEPAPFDPEFADANRIFSRAIDDSGPSELLYAGLSWRAGQLTLACARADLLALDKLEAGGLLPDDARRPELPPPVTATPVTPGRCIDPAIQAQAGAMFDGGADPYVDQVGEQRDYWDRLARWLRWGLEKSGRADAAQLDELQYAAEDMRRADEPGDPLAAVTGLLGSIPALEDARKSGDPRRICEAYAETSAFMASDLQQRTGRSKALAAVWAAEAARLGVALD